MSQRDGLTAARNTGLEDIHPGCADTLRGTNIKGRILDQLWTTK